MSHSTIMQLHRECLAKERIINEKCERIKRLEIEIIRLNLELEKAKRPWWKKLWGGNETINN